MSSGTAGDEVTIVIPHRDAEVLVDCLDALYAHSHWPIRVLVVDDGPDAPSLQRARERFPQIEVLRNDRNLGFCYSCNRGLEAAAGAYAVLLNDDTRVTDHWLRPLVEMGDSDPAIAACQPKLLSATRPDFFDYAGGAGGYIDGVGFTFCRGRMIDHLERDEGQYDAPVPLFWACGSALFLRLEAAVEVGLLDLGFFMHFEEIDLCWRLRLAGYRIMSVPSSVVLHHSGWSLPPTSHLKKYLNHRNNLVLLFKNMSVGRLAWLLPLRMLLELAACLGYLLGGNWRASLAPLASLGWCLSHPFDLLRRRRRSQSIRRPAVDALGSAGVYRGSILLQYYLRRRRTAAALVGEEEAP